MSTPKLVTKQLALNGLLEGNIPISQGKATAFEPLTNHFMHRFPLSTSATRRLTKVFLELVADLRDPYRHIINFYKSNIIESKVGHKSDNLKS